MMKLQKTLLSLCFAISVSALATETPTAESVYFVSGPIVRHGCIYRPAGEGPFPAMIYNQATSKPALDLGDSTPFAELARFYTSRGYVLFLPGRRAVSEAEQKKINAIEDENQRFMSALEIHNKDLEAAVTWLKEQTYVDAKKIFMSGHSTGGIQSLLLAEKNLGIRGIISFSPGAKVWSTNPLLRDTLFRCVKSSKTPVFLIQPKNDFSLGPVDGLGPELAAKGGANRAKVYSSFGFNQTEGNSFAFNAPDLWCTDVLAFMDDALKQIQ